MGEIDRVRERGERGDEIMKERLCRREGKHPMICMPPARRRGIKTGLICDTPIMKMVIHSVSKWKRYSKGWHRSMELSNILLFCCTWLSFSTISVNLNTGQ